MLLILPPSETKRDGGVDGSKLDLGALSFPELTRQRGTALAALRRVSASFSASSAALKLSPSQRFEIERNRGVRSSPVLPAVDRYTGVLYDALDAGSLNGAARRFAEEHLVVHSALFGLVRGADAIPSYRLSHDSRLPGLVLRRLWAPAITSVLDTAPGLVLDLRSESYVHLGPAPGAWFVRVVSGEGRALNHFNKHGKGSFVRSIAIAGLDHADVDSLLHWAAGIGVPLRRAGDELQLTVEG
jgi:cytoplasmic iron level regulating protein YaaA (DUF328/UPF0246 family)